MFDPERFTPERFGARERNAYYPFGRRQRMCIGEPMSLAIAQTLIASLAQAFDLKSLSTPVPHYAMTLQPKGGLRTRVTAR